MRHKASHLDGNLKRAVLHDCQLCAEHLLDLREGFKKVLIEAAKDCVRPQALQPCQSLLYIQASMRTACAHA